MRSLLALFLALAAGAAAAEQLADGIAAQVGSEIVLVSEVSEAAAPTAARAHARGRQQRGPAAPPRSRCSSR